MSVEHYALDLLAAVISENKGDHLLSCYCVSSTLLEFLELVVIGNNLMRFCSHFTDRKTKVLPDYLVNCCKSRPHLVLMSELIPSLFIYVYWLISLFLQRGVKNRSPVISP